MISDEQWADLVRLRPFHCNGGDESLNTPLCRSELLLLRNALNAALKPHRLTPTEHDIATRLAFGEDPPAIAKFRDVSICTVRTQLSKIYSAADCPGRSSFVTQTHMRMTRFLLRHTDP